MSFARYENYKDSGVEWLGEVPGGWVLTKLKYVASFSGGGTPSRDNLSFWNGSIPWVSPKDMKSERIVSTEEFITEEGLASSASSIIPVGSVLLVVRSGILKHTIPVAINDVPVSLNQDMKALVFTEELCANSFFLRWVQGHNYQLLLAWSKQGATVESIEHSCFAETIIPLPPLSEQHAIAAFLDRETAKIDALIAGQQRLIALLAEKRQAVISHAVTKGLNPDASMKDSGIEWLGEVPEGWEVMKLRRCIIEHRQGYYTTDPYVDSGVRLLRITDLQEFGRIDFSECPFVEYLEAIEPFLLRKNDFVFARTGGAGTFGLVENIQDYVAYASYLIRFRFTGSTMPCFLKYFFVSPCFQLALKQNIHGGVNQNVHAEDIKDQFLALPTMTEQCAIVSFLDTETAKLDALTAEAQRAITLLQERRTALISSAVTGKIDVRGS